MNNRNYQNNQFLHKPDGWGRYTGECLIDFLAFTEIAYDQLIHDLAAIETPACINNGYVFFGQDQAVCVPIEELLNNLVSWHTFYEQRLYGEDLTT